MAPGRLSSLPMNKDARVRRRWAGGTARSGAVVLMLALAAVFAGSALAYYADGVTGSGSASVGTLDAPTSVQTAAGAGTVALTWHAVLPPAADAVSYYVSRDGTPAGGACGSPEEPITGTSCTDTGLSEGSHSYTVTAVWRSWTATSSPAVPVTLASGAAARIVLSGSTDDLASGSSRQLTATIEDAAGNTVTSGPDSVADIDFQQTSGAGSVSGTGSATASGGVATTTVTGVSAGPVGLVATATLSGPGSTSSNALGFTVTPVPPDAARSTLTPVSSSITADGTATQVLTVQAKDASGNDETTGGATVTITRSAGTGTIGPVTDDGDGTYTAIVTAPTAPGSGVFAATLDGQPVDGGTGSQTLATVSYVAGPAAGLVLSEETVAPDPDVACAGQVGGIACSSYGEPNSTGSVLTAKLTLVDRLGNPVVSGSSVGIDLAATGWGSVDPSGTDALTVPAGASTTSASFTATRHNGNNKMLAVTATVHGTGETITIVLSSEPAPGGGSVPAPPATTTATGTTTAATDTTQTTTEETTTDSTTTADTTTDVTTSSNGTNPVSAGENTAGLSTSREVLFFAVLGGSLLALAALLTMPIPRRRKRRKERA